MRGVMSLSSSLIAEIRDRQQPPSMVRYMSKSLHRKLTIALVAVGSQNVRDPRGPLLLQLSDKGLRLGNPRWPHEGRAREASRSTIPHQAREG